MIAKALEMLVNYSEQAAQELTTIRTQITDSFSKDYVISASTMERLIKAQFSVRHWAKIQNIIARCETDQDKVAGLQKWISTTTEQLTECGRSRSTSLVASAEMEFEEDELKQVLRMVKQFVDFAQRS